MLPCICSVIDHRWRQNVVKTKKWHTSRRRVCHCCFYHILTSSVIYYWTDLRQHGIYLFYIMIRKGKDRYTYLVEYIFCFYDRAIFLWPSKMVSVSVICFSANGWKDQNMDSYFPAKKTLIWLIVLQYDVKAKYRLISRKFSGMKFFHPSVRLTKQKPRAFESVR